ncbi:ABC transporter substrate-binding protein [Ideonella sp.]|jgi:ABC-type amino acid transport substrate-binding protein|uniref:ABC transporter substrate-binding protein n=1 Tax=Ideonella sp. TaxID=1929293 RepID=UPI0037BF9828
MSQIQRRHFLGATTALALGGVASAAPAQTSAMPTPTLDKLRTLGRLSVAIYNDLPPFHVAGKGIEVDLAEALAQALGLKLSLLPFNAGEDMKDDLRNMVWRGHYLGFGPADVMLHVPVDRPLMEANKQVQVFAPYYRERVMLARRVADVPQADSLDAFKGKKIAVPGQTLAGWLLIGAEGGAYRNQLLTKLKDGVEAAQALQRGEVAAAAGQASELESVLAGDDRYAIDPLPVPRMKEGWAVGCAVKAEAQDLAQALQAAMNGLASSGKLAEMFAKARVKWRPV